MGQLTDILGFFQFETIKNVSMFQVEIFKHFLRKGPFVIVNF